MDEPKIYTTADWAAHPVSTVFAQEPAEGIIIHNMENANRTPATGPAEENAAFAMCVKNQINHMQGNGWADTGQQFTISRGGLILEGRHGSLNAAKNGKVVHGAHAGVAQANSTWFGIEMEGNYVPAFTVPNEQWAALIELCAWLAKWSGIDSSAIEGHMHFHSTDCPGKIMEHLGALRASVHDRKVAIG
jgi:hypothetical protein